MANELEGDPAHRLRSAPSIPSKFETVLHFGAQEKDAFWNRTIRFNDHINPLPGPGAYSKQSGLEKTTTSIGKKGYGTGFVSKSRRFSADPIFRSPGPGSYVQPSFVESKKSSSRLKCTPTFAPRVVPKIEKPNLENVGPGSYYPQDAESPTEKKKPSAIFKSTTDRFGNPLDAKDMPAPGQYNVDTSLTLKYAGISSAFKSKTGRKYERDKALPGAVTEAYCPPIHIASTLGVELPKTHAKINNFEIPGPGQYELPPAAIVEKDAHRLSSMFNPSEHDRFAKPGLKSLTTPGPGSYDVSEKDKQASLISSSFFMSSADRGFSAFNPHQARPGPAYYTPAAPNKKSFHLNIARRWV